MERRGEERQVCFSHFKTINQSSLNSPLPLSIYLSFSLFLCSLTLCPSLVETGALGATLSQRVGVCRGRDVVTSQGGPLTTVINNIVWEPNSSDELHM